MVGLTIGHFNPINNTFTETQSPLPMNSNAQMDRATVTSSTQNATSHIMLNMSPDQKKMLGALGIDINKITPAMISCAEKGLGMNRIEEIKNGASLSFGEKATLIACYK
jgi:hypothetical protein